MKDEQFVARVRRHRPSALVPLIARFASTHMERETWFRPGARGFGTPWALAEIARVSIGHGNEHRQNATLGDVVACNDAYNELEDPELVEGYQGPLAGFFLRMTEQLEYQLPLQNEMSRSVAIFSHTKPVRPVQVMKPGWELELLGVNLITFIAAGQMLHIAAKPNQGRFNPAWLDLPNFSFLPALIDPRELQAAWRQNYVIDPATFAAQNGRPRSSPWRRFGHNPLLSRPVVSDLHQDWLLPAPGLIVRRLSPLGIYYAGMERWGKAFADDLGDLFEQYVGDQLRLMPSATVQSAFTYDSDKRETVDYIVTLPDVVVLVEVKSVRPTAPVRAGRPDASTEVRRMLGKGILQLERADRLIKEQHPAFAHIPLDRPRVGFLVTIEDFHVLNSVFHQSMFDRTNPDLPLAICSVGEIEHWVTVKELTPGELVLAALAQMDNREGAGFALRQELVGREHDRNQLIDAAWATGPWQQLQGDG